jgi:hypothetical protein
VVTLLPAALEPVLAAWELLDPLEPLEPLDPLEPLEPLDPIELVEPFDPIERVEPLEPLDPVDVVDCPELAATVDTFRDASAGSCPVVSTIAISSQLARNTVTAPTATRRRIIRARLRRAARIDSPLALRAPAAWWDWGIIVGFLSRCARQMAVSLVAIRRIHVSNR